MKKTSDMTEIERDFLRSVNRAKRAAKRAADKLAGTETKTFKSRTILAGMNAKTVKGDDSGYVTAIMYLAPYTSSGMGNVCPLAEMAQCHGPCLNYAGRAEYLPSIHLARIAKTKRYFASRVAFMAELVRDIESFVAWCKKLDVKPAIRLNGTSDIQYEIGHACYREYVSRDGKRKVIARERVKYDSIFDAFPDVQFYDYTKIAKRAYRKLPDNYVLTLSYSAANPAYAESIRKAASDTGNNIAVVYRSAKIRDSEMESETLVFGGARVLNGDLTDLRFLDPKGSIVGLYAKGKNAKTDYSG